MNKKIIKLLSCLIPNKKLRRRFRNKHCSSLIYDKGLNNKFILLDEDGNVTDEKYIQNLEVSFEGDNNTVILYKNLSLRAPFQIKCTDENIVKIGNTHKVNKITMPGFMAKGFSVVIGDNFWGVDVDIIAHNEPNLSVKIGDECMFSPDVVIRPSDGHTIYDEISGEILNQPQNIIIGNHCWLAAYVKVLKGANIPDNSVVGLGSIYTKSSNKSKPFSGGGIYVGAPARLIKDGINWNRKRVSDFTFEK